MTLRLFLLQPTAIFGARVNQASFTYPLDEVIFDAGGGSGTVHTDHTVLFGTSQFDDDLGRQRVRDGSTAAAATGTMAIGRSSQGVRDGEVKLQDDAWITIINDFRVWAKIPFIDSDGTIYKDSSLTVGNKTGTDTPPVANAGVGFAATIDSGTSKITASWDASTNSFAVADGESISSYAWDVDDGTITVGTSSSAAITATFPAGFRYVKLTVTDSNSQTHSCHVPVFARDPASDLCISAFNIDSHTITAQGQQLNIRIREAIAEGTYPDGTLVMLWEDEPASAADRSHMIFIGWHHNDPATITAQRTGILQDTVLECLDVAGKLDKLPGFPQEIHVDATPATWNEMLTPNMDKYLHYLLHWHSTALVVADWTDSGTGSNNPFVILGSDGESLYDQVERRARALVPDYHLTCSTLGQLQTVVDPMLQDTGDRTATVQATLTEADWSDISYTHQRPPRAHWHRGNAIVASASTIAAIFCIAPGESPGQGETAQEHGEQLAQSQSDLNACEGHRYARLNAFESTFSIVLAEGADKAIEPANLTWVRLTVSSDTAAQRGLTFSTERGLPLELNISYEHARTGLVKTVEMLWERETSGTSAVTVIPPPPPDIDDDWGDDDWDDEDDDNSAQNLAGINADGYLYTTSDFQTPAGAGGPTWARTNLSMGGTALTWVVDPFCTGYLGTGSSVDGWVATSTKLYKVDDIFGTPVVTEQFSFRATRSNRSMDASFGFQDWAICASAYADGVWVTKTTDGGTTWATEIQITAHVNTSVSNVRSGVHASSKSAGVAFVGAYSANGAGSDASAAIYKSSDYGASFSLFTGYLTGDTLQGSLEIPWHDNDNESLQYVGWWEYVSASPGDGGTAVLARYTAASTYTDISPTDGNGPYTAFLGQDRWAIKSFSLDRRYLVLCASSFNTQYAGVWVSSDYGDNWTVAVAVDNSGSWYKAGAFGGDSPNILYLWGDGGKIAYSNNGGASIDDRRGNIPTDFVGIGLFVGIAGD